MTDDALEGPNWDRIENDVMERLRYLRAIWEHVNAREPTNPRLARLGRDLVTEALRPLVEFCTGIDITAVDIGEEKVPCGECHIRPDEICDICGRTEQAKACRHDAYKGMAVHGRCCPDCGTFMVDFGD